MEVIVAIVGIVLIVGIIRLVWNVLSIDWFGIDYEDPTSPYYHDKRGQGRGR